jgi:flagella basal body P-ring formation protein FlgA
MKRLLHIIMLTLITLCASVSAAQSINAASAHAPIQTLQAHDTLQRAITEYLRVQTGSLPGRVTYSAGAIDSRLMLAACGALEVFLPPGARLWGNTSLGVRCNAPVAWSIYVAVKVIVTGAYVTTSRALPAGQLLSEADLAINQGDLTQMPGSTITETSQALGKFLVHALAAGQAMRADLLRTPSAILHGQNVKVVSQGKGFSVSAEGKALGNASVGQVAQVRMNSGQTVSGIARADGLVEVQF